MLCQTLTEPTGGYASVAFGYFGLNYCSKFEQASSDLCNGSTQKKGKSLPILGAKNLKALYACMY